MLFLEFFSSVSCSDSASGAGVPEVNSPPELLLVYDGECPVCRAYSQMVNTYEDSLVYLTQEITDLENYIKELLYGKIYTEVPEPEEVMPVEPEVEEIFMLVEEKTSPMRGMEKILSELQYELSRFSTRYTGEIVLRFKVRKDGNIRGRVLHASEDAQDIARRALRFMHNEKWRPATHRGKRHESTFELALNITR